MGIYNACMHLGLTAGPLAGVLTARVWIGNEPFLLYAAVCLIGGALVLIFVENPQAGNSGRAKGLDHTHAGLETDLCLVGTALVTALPLLLFTRGARRLHLSTIGFLQYIVPSSLFLLSIFVFDEPITRVQVWSFIIIWSALLIYTVESTIYFRRQSDLLHTGSKGP